jgi:trimethylamine--corrinoid protein Co-methyltransferase
VKPEAPRVLSEEDIGRIHQASVEILEKTGSCIQNAELRSLLARAGARVDEAAGVVRFPRRLTESLLGKAPRTFTIHARNGSAPLTVGGGDTRSVAGFDAPFFFDAEKGVRRPIMRAEVGRFAWIADRLDEVAVVGNQGIPQDVPPGTEEAWAVAELLENTGKHLIVAPDTGAAARAIYRMIEAVSGTPEIGREPLVCCHISPSSPLRWTPKACEVILETVRRGVPFLILPAPMAGATSPVTIAGHLTMHNSEVLSGYLVSQILREGHPVVYCNAHTIFNLREGNPVIATPETLLLRIAGAQMARRYGIPSHSIGFDTDAHLTDAQGSWEKALSAMACVQAGMDFLVNLGMFSTGLAVSYEQLLLDAEVFGLLQRFSRGIDVSDETIASPVIQRVGNWGAFLEEEHTIAHYREENWYPTLSCRKLFDPWSAAGAKDAVQMAREKAAEMLAAERRPYLDGKRKAELERIIREVFAAP